MNAKEILGIGVKLIGVWLIVQAIGQASYTLTQFHLYLVLNMANDPSHQYIQLPAVIASLLITLAYLGFGIIFIGFSSKVTSILMPAKTEDGARFEWNEIAIGRVGLVLMGAYFLATAIPPIIQNLWLYMDISQEHMVNVISARKYLIISSTSLAQLIIGLFLIFKSNGIAKYFHKLQGSKHGL